ncbi:MAG: hypothetical protein IAB99_05445 [Bacteroidetes bacterium]|uniref:Uncharacterized protein n=1 Tax=Candidatus Cryptobacteroides faecipullorum TaxID=2840764 RepID=A0A9D9NB39_9BACT|nr:hypothetical protein [Candidatus Cryptobacteroides faecipullorum]
MQKKETKTEKAFRKGLRNLKVKDYMEVKDRIYDILGVSARQTFAAYADGKRQLDIDKYKSIDMLFKEHGVNDCWGV